MADLWWIKLEVGRVRDLTAGLSLEARAAWMPLVFAAWMPRGDAAPPCALPDDDAQLARLAGLTPAEWKRARAEIRARFPQHPDVPGYLQAPWLRALFDEQTAARAKAIVRAQKGGKAGGRGRGKPKPADSSRTASPQLDDSSERSRSLGSQIQKGSDDPAPTGAGIVQIPAAGAVAAGAAPLGGALAAPATADGPGADAPHDGPPAPDALRRALEAEPALAELLARRGAVPGGERRDAAGLEPAFGTPLDDRPRQRTQAEARALVALIPDRVPQETP